MILCFSGTGNSRYIAGRFAEELQEEIVDINTKIKANDTSAIKTGKDVIVVVPTYAWRIPRIVTEWLQKTELTDAERIWFVMSCGGQIGNAKKYNSKLANKKKLEYMGTAEIVMPENYIAMFDAPDNATATRIVKLANPKIAKAITTVKSCEHFPEPKISATDKLLSSAVNSLFYPFAVKAKDFKASEECIGCGKCVKNCPLNNIQLEDKRPVWGKDCTHCMACICYCPTEAIEYGKKSVGKPRYHFEALEID